MHFHESQERNFFAIPKTIKCQSGGYSTVTFPEMILFRENANIKLIVNDEGYVLAYGSDNTLLVDKSFINVISIQRKFIRRQTYWCTNIIKKVLSKCLNYYLCNNSVEIDNKIASKIKRYWQIISSLIIKMNRWKAKCLQTSLIRLAVTSRYNHWTMKQYVKKERANIVIIVFLKIKWFRDQKCVLLLAMCLAGYRANPDPPRFGSTFGVSHVPF